MSQWVVYGYAGESSSIPPRKQTMVDVVMESSFTVARMATVLEYRVDLPEESIALRGSTASRISLNLSVIMPETAVNSKLTTSEPFKMTVNRTGVCGDGPPVSNISPAVRLHTKAPVFGLLKFMTQKYAGTGCQKGQATS